MTIEEQADEYFDERVVSTKKIMIGGNTNMKLKKIDLTINPTFRQDEKPGQFIRFSIFIPCDIVGESREKMIGRQILNRLKWSIDKEINIDGKQN